jgi:hypothetical protein
MLICRPLEEAAHEPGGIRQVWLGVDVVPQATNNAVVLHRVHLLLLRRLVTAHPEPLLHWRCCRLAIYCACHLHDLLGIVRLP